MRYNEFIKHLQKGDIAPVYFFHGEEEFLIEEATQRIMEAVIQPDVREFNCDIFYGAETESLKVINIAKSFPMMAEKRLIVVKEVQKLSPAQLNHFAVYSENPVSSTCLILVAPTGQLRGKVYSKLKDNAVAVEFRPLYDNQVPLWVKQYVKSRGAEITDNAIIALQAFVGNKLLNIVNELTKIFLNLGERKQIDEDDVQFVVGFSKEYTIYHLLNAIGNKSLEESLLIMKRLLGFGEKPSGMIVRISNHFISLQKTMGMLNRRSSDTELARVTGVHPFFVKDLKSQVRNFSANQLEHAFALLMDADLNLKTSYQSNEMVMTLLVYHLVRL
ncbi:MAG: DNA polymerase III subunit delta [candidate division KSB1 bacterium]|jgi:DNA polymerase-3 subunit delta|nr:DNA polymerase III subunit delta [candidate division KSB1 bacterium]